MTDQKFESNQEKAITTAVLKAQQMRTMQHRFKRASDIVIPEIMFHPIKFSETIPNIIFSEPGGIIPSQVIIVTGEAGAGKTTLMSKLGAILKPSDIPEIKNIIETDPVLISLEMSDYQLKLQAKKIDGFDKYQIVSEVTNLDELLEDLKALKPSAVVLDSIQKLANHYGGKDKDQIAIVEKFTKFAKETFIPVFLIGHCNKDGSYKGPSTLLHEIDTHLHLYIEKDTGDRYFRIFKNRFGGDATPIPWRIERDRVVIGGYFNPLITEDPVSGEPPRELTLDEALPVYESELVKFVERSRMQPKHTDFADTKRFLAATMEYLRVKHRSLLIETTVAKNANFRVEFKDTGGASWCNAHKNLINYTATMFNSVYPGWRSKYKKETPFMNKWCGDNKEKVVLWIALHEFTHLFEGKQNHFPSFFEKVEWFAKENEFIFRAIDDILAQPAGTIEGHTALPALTATEG